MEKLRTMAVSARPQQGSDVEAQESMKKVGLRVEMQETVTAHKER